MGRKRKSYVIDADGSQFHELDVEYTRNDYKDVSVDALNSLPPDERSIMILYISVGNNKKELAKRLGCSRTHIHETLKRIQDKLKEQINQKLNDENNY